MTYQLDTKISKYYRFALQLSLEINKLKTEKDDLSFKITELKEQIASQPTPNGTTSPDKVIFQSIV